MFILSYFIISLLSDGFLVSFFKLFKPDTYSRSSAAAVGGSGGITKALPIINVVLKYSFAFIFLASLGMSLRIQLNGTNTSSVLGASWAMQSCLPGGSVFSQTAIYLGTAFHVMTL